MQKEKREIYLQLMSLAWRKWSGLCCICRYAEFIGRCGDADLICHCGIDVIEGNSYGVWGGDDCWAFRPLWSLDDITDAVGLILQGDWPDMSNCTKWPAKPDYLKGVKNE